MALKQKVKLYSTKTCPRCEKAKEFFQAHKIQYKAVDVSEDEEAAQEMIQKSGQMGVPVIEIDGQIIVGYDEAVIKKALKIAK